MSKLVVYGGVPLCGEITVSGNKNAVLPMICASLLSRDPVALSNMPAITDGLKIAQFFRDMGAEVVEDQTRSTIRITHAPYCPDNKAEIPTGIRSAVLLIAPLLHLTGGFAFDQDAKGCALGVREIDPHLGIIAEFGCTVTYNGTSCLIKKPETCKPANIWMDYQSVTATETFLMMAALTKGKSRLTNAASEPHVKYFCEFLIQMGAKITGLGTSILEVDGVDTLSGVDFRVPDDHHEAATFAAIGAATGGTLLVKTHIVDEMTLIVRQFQKVGLNMRIVKGGIQTGPSNFKIEEGFTPEILTKVEAAPWPYFPADILPQIIGASIQAKGELLFWNKVYEGALFWSSELLKFGARAHLSDPHRLVLTRNKQLRPATVEAPYIIRVVLGLVIAALQIEGRSEILNAAPIRRAHPDFIEKLRSLGARIEWVDTP